jgi:heat shock protein HslJ
MKRWLLILVIALLSVTLLFMLGCGGADTGTDTTVNTDGSTTKDAELVGPVWKLTQMAGPAVGSDIAPIADDINVTIEFDAEGMYFAQAPVNTVRGPYVVDGESLTLEDGASTLMAGIDEAHNEAETTFIGLLARVKTFKILADSLSLYDDAHILILEFMK